MQTSATNKRLRVLLVGIRDKTLIPNPNFQRRLVWVNKHKVAFLRTVLEGLPFPEIFIASGDVDPETGDGTELIVDGQQRVTTLYQYFIGSPELRLADEVPRYTDLEESQKLKFLEYEVVVRDLGPITEEDTRDIFNRINSTSYALNAMEVNNSRFDGELKMFSQTVAEGEFFDNHKVFTALDGRRMNDVRFSLTLIISLIAGYFNRDDEHEAFLARFNDEFPQKDQVWEELKTVFDFIDSCNFASEQRVWQKADLLTLVVEIHRLLIIENITLDSAAVKRTLTEFYSRVEAVPSAPKADAKADEYYRRVRGGINDRVSRISRGEILSALLRSITE